MYPLASRRQIGALGQAGGGGDSIAPTVTITSTESSPSYAYPIPLTITFSESVTGFVVGDLTLANCTAGEFAGSGADYTVNLYRTAAAITVDIAGGVCVDAAGNGNTAATQFAITNNLLMLDLFTTNDAAPITTPRTAEPYGTLVITDTANKLAIASGLLTFTGGGTGDPAIWGSLQTLTSGLASYAKMQSDPNANTYLRLGWDSNQAGASLSYIRYDPASQTVNFAPLSTDDPLSLPRATMHEYITIHRGGTGGMFALAKNSGGSWVLLGMKSSTSATHLYPVIHCPTYVSGSAYADNFKLVNLPAPFNTATGLATDILTGSRSQGDTFTHTADCWIEFTCTTLPASGQHEIQFRKQDATNYWQVTIDSSGAFDLDEVVSGTPTQRATSAGVIANGDRIVIRAIGTAIRVFEGAEGETSRLSYTSATNFATATAGSLLTLGTSGVISNIASYPRTISGTALSVINAAFP
jgi:hypothetical protein